MDVDDDDAYMNAAAAHAAFVMTGSAASMYWLLRHAQHARDINIHKLHPLLEKIGLGRSADFLHSGTGYIENSRVRSMIAFLPISVRIFQNEHDFNHNFLHSGTPLLTRDHTVLPATHKFIHKRNEPYLPLLPSRRASRHFGRY